MVEFGRPGTPLDAVVGIVPSFVFEPADERETASILRNANETGLSVIPTGGGTKLDWGNPPRKTDILLSMRRQNRVIEHAWADLTVTVEAGCTVADLQRTLAEHGQRLAIDPLWPERATIGGILATNDSGALRLRYGALRDLIIGVTLALADGTIAMSGGKVVKNVAGYDLPKLATGALGSLGVITRAVFRLHPLPRNTRTLTVPAEDAAEMQRMVLAILDARLVPAAVQTRFGSVSKAEVDILLEGTPDGIAAQESAIRKLGTAGQGLPAVWNAREELWGSGPIVKFSTLPSRISLVWESLERFAHAPWSAVVQATGIGYARFDGDLQGLRTAIEEDGGSLVILGRTNLDTWGSPGDALPLMQAVKKQLDPKDTLNPGRFVGSI